MFQSPVIFTVPLHCCFALCLVQHFDIELYRPKLMHRINA